MNEQEYRKLIKTIVQEVVKRLENRTVFGRAGDHWNVRFFQTLVIVPGSVPFRKKAVECLYQEYGTDMAFLTADDQFDLEYSTVFRAGEMTKNEWLDLCEKTKQVVLLAPSLELLSRIAGGDDRELPEYLFLHAALWNKDVSIYLDFLPEKVYGSQMQRMLQSFRFRGIPIHCYCRKNIENAVPGGEKAGLRNRAEFLITETDIVEVFQKGRNRFICEPGSIVTPLARDKAKELGITFQNAGG